MALLTPLGPLDRLDTTRWETQKDLLSMDKHRLLEGLAIEGTMDALLRQMPALGARPLPISLLRAARRGRPGFFWWLWNRVPDDPAAGRLFDRLAADTPESAILCDYDEARQDFVISRYFRCVGESVQRRLMRQRRVQAPAFARPEPLLQETERVLTAFFRLRDSAYARDMFRDVILHRLYKNCVIQPFYDYLWDIDTLLELPGGRLVQLEIKHKYPGGRDALFFGLNNGQARTMLELARRGIDTFHINIVKPYWNSRTGTGYLLSDPSLRDHVLVVGHYLDREALEALNGTPSAASGKTESLYGRRAQNFKPIPVTDFVRIGTLNDLITAGPAGLLAGIERRPLPRLTAEELLARRLG